MFSKKIEDMEEGKEKELLKILDGKAKPFLRKCDGYAVKVEEDKEIKYKDYNDQELTLKVPEGSYVVVGEDSCYPKIVTSEDFESKNKFVSGEEKPKEKKKENGPKIVIALVSDQMDEN